MFRLVTGKTFVSLRRTTPDQRHKAHPTDCLLLSQIQLFQQRHVFLRLMIPKKT